MDHKMHSTYYPGVFVSRSVGDDMVLFDNATATNEEAVTDNNMEGVGDMVLRRPMIGQSVNRVVSRNPTFSTGEKLTSMAFPFLTPLHANATPFFLGNMNASHFYGGEVQRPGSTLSRTSNASDIRTPGTASTSGTPSFSSALIPAVAGMSGIGGIGRRIQQASDNLEDHDNLHHQSHDAQASNSETNYEQRVKYLERLLEATEAVYSQHMVDMELLHRQQLDEIEAEHRQQLENVEAERKQQIADFQELNDERNAVLARAARNQVDSLVEKLQRATMTVSDPERFRTCSAVESRLASWRQQDHGQDITAVIAMAKEKRVRREEHRAKIRASYEAKRAEHAAENARSMQSQP